MVATRSAPSTVDESQSASKAIYHSYPSESRGGPGPTWLSEGGWAVGGGGKKEVEGVLLPECSPPARRLVRAKPEGRNLKAREGAFTGGAIFDIV